MKPTLKWLFMFGTLNVFCSLMPSSTISAKLGCTHPAMQITRIGTEQQYTQDSHSQYCYYVYERFHASCSTCGYDGGLSVGGALVFCVSGRWLVGSFGFSGLGRALGGLVLRSFRISIL